jgi:hypothetical protein
MEKPDNFSPSAAYLLEHQEAGFKGVNKRLDTQNGRIRSLEVSRGYAVGFIAAVVLIGSGVGVILNVF